MRMGRVLVLGGSNTDLVCRAPRMPQPGETLNGRSIAIFAGGKGANQAVAAARSGATVHFCGAVGDDDFGRQRLADLQRDGIDTSQVQTIAGCASGVALIVVDDAGENQIVVIPGANGQVGGDYLAHVVGSTGADVLLVVLEVPLPSIAQAVAAAAGKMRVVVNAAPFHEAVRELVPHIDVLVCNETEAAAILGRAVTPASATSAALALRELGCRTAIITIGPHGAAVADGDDTWLEPAPDVQVVDTTGAGDSFCGALAAWLADGATVRQAVRAGVVAGSLAVTQEGAQPSIPERSAILDVLDGGHAR
jgi:ribokinase